MTEIPFELAEEGKNYYVSRIVETGRGYGHGWRQKLINFQIIPGSEISILKKANLMLPYLIQVGASRIILCKRLSDRLLLCDSKEDLQKIKEKF